MDFKIVLQQMEIIALLVGVGYLLSRLSWIGKAESACVSGLIVNVFNPAIIISSVFSSQDNGEAKIGYTFFAAALLFFLLIFFSIFFARILKKNDYEQRVFLLCFTFTNLGFIGIPVVGSMFGQGALIHVAVFMLLYNVLFYTYGIFLFRNRNEKFSWKSLRPMLNMGMLSCVIAVLLFFLPIKLPLVLSSTITYLGNAATPLALIIIGVSIGTRKNILAVFQNKRLYLFAFFKMILIPIVFTLILKRLPIPEEVSQIGVILMAMPVGSMPLLMISQRNLDGTLCSDSIILTTLLSVVTIPLLVFLYPYL